MGVPAGAATTLLDRAARDHPIRDAIVDGRRRWSWSSVRDLVDRGAARLADRGVQPGDRVAIVSRPGPATVVALFACWRIGAVAVPLDPSMRSDRLAERLATASPSLVVCELAALDAIEAARPRMVGCRAVLATDPMRWGLVRDRVLAGAATIAGVRRRPRRDDDVASWDALLDAGPALVRQHPTDGSAPAAIVWTAGTTARARPVVLTHGNLVANAVQLREWVVDVRDGREVVVAAAPPWRGDGLVAGLLAPVLVAATVAVVRSGSSGAVARAVERSRASLVVGPPALFAELVERTRRHDLGSIGIALSVGAPLVADVVRRFEDALPAARLRQAYGQTESTAVALAAPLYGGVDRGPVGLPVSDTVAVVATLDDPTLLAPVGDIGQLLVAGPQVAAGLWRGGDVAPTPLGPWLETGDAASLGEDGVFTLHGRIGQLLRTEDGLVVPSRVERALRRHPRVADAAVVAVTDEDGDTRIVAVVEPEGRRRPTARRLLTHLGSLVAPHELPDVVVVDRELPRTATGAIDRHRVRARHGLARAGHRETSPATVRDNTDDRRDGDPGRGPDAPPDTAGRTDTSDPTPVREART